MEITPREPDEFSDYSEARLGEREMELAFVSQRNCPSGDIRACFVRAASMPSKIHSCTWDARIRQTYSSRLRARKQTAWCITAPGRRKTVSRAPVISPCTDGTMAPPCACRCFAASTRSFISLRSTRRAVTATQKVSLASWMSALRLSVRCFCADALKRGDGVQLCQLTVQRAGRPVPGLRLSVPEHRLSCG